MDFRTELSIRQSAFNLAPGDPVFTVGSCFADSMGQRFTFNKFKSTVNPFGTTYHPFAIHKLLTYASKLQFPEASSYLENNQTYYNFDFHSSISGTTQLELQSDIKKLISTTNEQLSKAKLLIVTYGTAWIYERADNDTFVANCHKLPSGWFRKKLISTEEIVKSFDNTIEAVLKLNAGIRIVLTCSPVRHLKDTIELNSVSKAILRTACHLLTERYDNVEYFPAFEIMMDDLRDYRFYKNDMIHPTPLAEDYIWEKFCSKYMSANTLTIIKRWLELSKAIEHKAFQPASPSHQKFLKDTLLRLKELEKSIDVSDEIKEINSQLI